MLPWWLAQYSGVQPYLSFASTMMGDCFLSFLLAFNPIPRIQIYVQTLKNHNIDMEISELLKIDIFCLHIDIDSRTIKINEGVNSFGFVVVGCIM